MSSMTMLAGRYRLEERIAAGGVGEVWRGVDAVLARPVAVKLLRAEYAQHAETLARFRAEARHAGSVSHPAIAQIHDYGEPDPPLPPYLVMELVDGPSLARLLAAGPLAPAAAMDVISQAAAGLYAAHRAGLVHRDIKPGNILIGPHGQVKITDFGIAHAAGSAPITGTGLVVGTPAYLAPERVTGAHATPAADLYALGVVAYECLAGTSPFTGTPLEVASAHRDLPLPALPGTVPPDVARLVADLTAKDPAARPPTAAEVSRRAALLRDAITAAATLRVDPGSDPAPTLAEIPLPGPPPVRPPSRWPSGWRDLASHRGFPARLVTLAAAALVVAGLAGLLIGGAFGGNSPAARPPAPSPTMVDVSGASLVGQPVSLVQARLRQLGLVVHVLRQPSGQPAGTVLSVAPDGRVPAGSVVTVTASQARGKGHGNGGDNGNGDNGNGG